MFRILIKNKKAQNTAEYALLIALVIAGAVAMQQYAQRALQARQRDAAVYFQQQTNQLGNSVQYEPYYQQTNYNVARESTENKRLGEGITAMDSANTRERTGLQSTLYDATGALATSPVATGAMPEGL